MFYNICPAEASKREPTWWFLALLKSCLASLALVEAKHAQKKAPEIDMFQVKAAPVVEYNGKRLVRRGLRKGEQLQ